MKYNTTEQEVIIKLSTRCDKFGNCTFMVEYNDDYACFQHMSSALDFIQTNFKQ